MHSHFIMNKWYKNLTTIFYFSSKTIISLNKNSSLQNLYLCSFPESLAQFAVLFRQLQKNPVISSDGWKRGLLSETVWVWSPGLRNIPQLAHSVLTCKIRISIAENKQCLLLRANIPKLFTTLSGINASTSDAIINIFNISICDHFLASGATLSCQPSTFLISCTLVTPKVP